MFMRGRNWLSNNLGQWITDLKAIPGGIKEWHQQADKNKMFLKPWEIITRLWGEPFEINIFSSFKVRMHMTKMWLRVQIICVDDFVDGLSHTLSLKAGLFPQWLRPLTQLYVYPQSNGHAPGTLLMATRALFPCLTFGLRSNSFFAQSNLPNNIIMTAVKEKLIDKEKLFVLIGS